MAAGVLIVGMTSLATTATARTHSTRSRTHHERIARSPASHHHAIHRIRLAHGAARRTHRREARARQIAAPAAGKLVQTGRASFYSGGGRTAAGGVVGAATCAHPSLPFGTRVLVTNLVNLHRAVLTVNDRGPFVHGRVIDVSRGAAGVLGMLQTGIANVRLEVLGRPG